MSDEQLERIVRLVFGMGTRNTLRIMAEENDSPVGLYDAMIHTVIDKAFDSAEEQVQPMIENVRKILNEKDD